MSMERPNVEYALGKSIMTEQVENGMLLSQSRGILIGRIGFWSAVLSAVFAVVSFALGVTIPPRSGSFAESATATD